MPPPLAALATIARRPDDRLSDHVEIGMASRPPVQFVLYELLRREQALAAGAQPPGRTEASRILDLAQSAYGELVGVLIGRPDEVLDTTRDGEWSLRDLLRHAIAVELRYRSQVNYSASRHDDEPLAIPDDRLPCDRLSPPDLAFADSRTAGITRVLELLGGARAQTDRAVSVLPDSALARPSLWGTLQFTVRMRLHQTAAHLVEVVVQSEKCLGDDLNVESRRILRHCCAVRGLHERWSGAEQLAVVDTLYSALAAAGTQTSP